MFKVGDIVTFKPRGTLPHIGLHDGYKDECAKRHGRAYRVRLIGDYWGVHAGPTAVRRIILDSLDGSEKNLVDLASYGLGDDSIQLFKSKYPTNAKVSS